VQPGARLQDLTDSGWKNLQLLECVALSEQDVIALVCHDDIKVTSAAVGYVSFNVLDSCLANRHSFAEIEDLRLRPRAGQVFVHAAFNDSGNLLFAWAMGSREESLYVWRLGANGSMKSEPEVESHYPSVRSTSLGAILYEKNLRFMHW
jgi:hypothetical protein